MYQGVYASKDSIKYKDEENLVVGMPHTVIHPNTVMILESRGSCLTTILRALNKILKQ